ncbi:unnamed protein product [Adineta ricciae]|uniref:Uncharacterized protein n=1 Tax=Adineta ricciae TaxID=249248 RepID=A0A815LIS5_ADIRI|nr:unnamed protein product [Adineta ricciae]
MGKTFSSIQFEECHRDTSAYGQFYSSLDKQQILRSIDIASINVRLGIQLELLLLVVPHWMDPLVEKWNFNTSTSASATTVSSYCSGLFIDINDTLYCSVYLINKVVKRWLYDSTLGTIDVPGSSTLYNPRGIFVDTNFDLYVVDCGNNRIQLFQFGAQTGITIAGNSSPNPTITLNWPSDIFVDLDHYLFIVDSGNNRIIRSSRNGFHCIIGCSGGVLSSTHLSDPRRMAFDSYGNIYVTDYGARCVLKFLLSNDLCSKYQTVRSMQQNLTISK